MKTVAVGDLRDNTAEVIREVRTGQTMVLTVRGEPIAQIVSLASHQRRFLSPSDVLRIPQTQSWGMIWPRWLTTRQVWGRSDERRRARQERLHRA